MKIRNEKFKDLIFYEIYPTSFYDSNGDGIGDLNGIKEKLTYVKDLGFNAIWINPFFKSPFKDGGYDIEDYYEIDPKFGTMDDFDDLIKKADEQDIKIVIDLVAGHSSETNKDFIKSGEWERNECSDLFIWNNDVWSLEEGCKLISGRYPRNGNYAINFFSFQPAFNYGYRKIEHPEWQMSYKDERTYKARNYMIDVIRFWLKKGVFGFRVDMAADLVKGEEWDQKQGTIEVWNYIFNIVRKEYPDAFFVSEWSRPNQSLDAGFDCDFMLDDWANYYNRLVRSTEETNGKSLLNGGDVDYFMNDIKIRFNQALERGGYIGNISGNHDLIRIANYLDTKRLKMFYTFMFSLPGIPFIYYGDEIEMKYKNIKNKDGGYHRTGSRTPMQWDHTINDGFSSAKEEDLYLPINTASDITLEDNLLNKDSIFYTIKELIKIRKSYSDLTSKDMFIEEKNRVISLKRNNIEIIMNCSDNEVNLTDEIIYTTGSGNILHSYESAIIKKAK